MLNAEDRSTKGWNVDDNCNIVDRDLRGSVNESEFDFDGDDWMVFSDNDNNGFFEDMNKERRR